jgi:hypothetical protein
VGKAKLRFLAENFSFKIMFKFILTASLILSLVSVGFGSLQPHIMPHVDFDFGD